MNGHASDQSKPAGARSEERVTPPDEDIADTVPERKVADDGSVPDKQIQRWKNEGGA